MTDGLKSSLEKGHRDYFIEGMTGEQKRESVKFMSASIFDKVLTNEDTQSIEGIKFELTTKLERKVGKIHKLKKQSR